MARDKNPYDDDYDGRPGGRGFSAEYARRYDPQGEGEYTNLPSNRIQLEMAHAEREAAERAEMLREMHEEGSSGRIQFWPNVGKFIIPVEETFAAHQQLVQKGADGAKLGFDTQAYRFFDRVIVETAGRPDIFDPNRATYGQYAPLRENLAALRNYVMGTYMTDGSFDPGDERYIPQLVSMATEVGRAISNEKRLLPALFAPSLDTKLLNMEGDGAAYAYRHLKKLERTTGLFNSVVSDIRRWMGMPVREWDLPPVEYTPFSEDGLNARAPLDPLTMSDEKLRAYAQKLALEKVQAQEQEEAAVEESLNNATKRETVEHGITILRWFKDIKFSDRSPQSILQDGSADEKREMVGVVAKFVGFYQQIMSRAMARDPSLSNSEQIQQGNEAAKVLKHSIELMAKLEKPKSIADTMSVSVDETRQPDKWNELKGHTVDRLMQTLKGALEHTFGSMEQQVDDHERAQEEAVEQTQDSLLSADMLKRKKRKLKQQKKSAQVNAFNQRRNANDVNGDGIADKFQGISSTQNPIKLNPEVQQPAKLDNLLKGLGLADIDALKSMVRGSAPGQQQAPKQGETKKADGGGGLSGLAVTDVSLNDKIAPDDVDVATRIIEQRKRDQQKGGPKTTI